MKLVLPAFFQGSDARRYWAHDADQHASLPLEILERHRGHQTRQMGHLRQTESDSMVAKFPETPASIDAPAGDGTHLVVQLGPAHATTPVAKPNEVESGIAHAGIVRVSTRIHSSTRSSSMRQIPASDGTSCAGSGWDLAPRVSPPRRTRMLGACRSGEKGFLHQVLHLVLHRTAVRRPSVRPALWTRVKARRIGRRTRRTEADWPPFFTLRGRGQLTWTTTVPAAMSCQARLRGSKAAQAKPSSPIRM